MARKEGGGVELGAHRVASPMGYCTTGCPETVTDGNIAARPGWRQPQTRPDVSPGRRAPARRRREPLDRDNSREEE